MPSRRSARPGLPGLLLILALVAATAAGGWPSARAQEAGEEQAPAGPFVPLADRLRPEVEGRVYLLKVNLHQPEQGGHPAPWIDERGWHRRDIQRPVILRAGERVQVTGVFTYGDRSVFLELTRWPVLPWGNEPARARIRFQAGSGPEEPDEQDKEVSRLIALVLGRASFVGD